MGKNGERIRVDPLMKFYIDQETRKLANKIKKETGLPKITIPNISGTHWLANQLLNNKALIRYKIKRVSKNEGVVEFL
tara:strand:+ start:1938 stop:2171 length:234 start_codon:yes stop_codon:yes gene_type:complete